MTPWTPALTGKQRHRIVKRWGREPFLVLQVQERRLVASMVGGSIDSERVEIWRDARVEDLTEQPS